jgi:hypothetical protein
MREELREVALERVGHESGQGVVDDAPERVHVGAATQRFATHLLRRDEVDGPDLVACIGHCVSVVLVIFATPKSVR